MLSRVVSYVCADAVSCVLFSILGLRNVCVLSTHRMSRHSWPATPLPLEQVCGYRDTAPTVAGIQRRARRAPSTSTARLHPTTCSGGLCAQKGNQGRRRGDERTDTLAAIVQTSTARPPRLPPSIPTPPSRTPSRTSHCAGRNSAARCSHPKSTQ